jgi:putative ABC transport system permease protein
VLSAFLGEAACFGAVGGLIGIFLGRLLAIGAVRLLGATVDNLYVSSTPAPIQLTPLVILLGLAIGVAVSLASAASPAREASLVSPVEAMARGEREYTTRVHKIRTGHRREAVFRIRGSTTIHCCIRVLHSRAGQRIDEDFLRHAAAHWRR